MTTPTAAARRLLAGPRSYRDGTHSEQADVQTVAEAVLSVPELDDTPITSEWIDSLGFTKGDMPFGGGTLSIYAKYDGGCNVAELEIRNNAEWYGCNHTIDLPLTHTRGQLRLLAMALGVTIRE